jgi:hypothetical protein
MLPAGFKNPNPVSEGPQTHTSDRAATVINFLRGKAWLLFELLRRTEWVVEELETFQTLAQICTCRFHLYSQRTFTGKLFVRFISREGMWRENTLSLRWTVSYVCKLQQSFCPISTVFMLYVFSKVGGGYCWTGELQIGSCLTGRYWSDLTVLECVL